MKQKTGRKLLSFLLTLAMVVGLMPGMSLTAWAEPAVTFGKVTDAEDITVENIRTCTFAEAKAWVVENWDAVHDTMMHGLVLLTFEIKISARSRC